MYVEVIDLYRFNIAQILINLSQHRRDATLQAMAPRFSTKLSTDFVGFGDFGHPLEPIWRGIPTGP